MAGFPSYSITGLAFLLVFFCYGLLTYRFFQYWQKSKDLTSKLFFYFSIAVVSLILVRAISGLLFAGNTQILSISLILVSFIEGIMAAIVAFLIVYLKFPKISPWLGFAVFLFLGLLATSLTIFVPKVYQPFLEPSGAINWGFNTQNSLYQILRVIVLFSSIVSLIVVFFQQGLRTIDKNLKLRAFGLAFAFSTGAIIGALDFLLIGILNLGAIIRDMATIIGGILLFLIIYFTQKPPQKASANQDNFKKIEF